MYTDTFSQGLTIGGQLGWGNPQGNVFKSSLGEDLTSGGISFDIDALYHLEQSDYKLGLGINYNSSFIFGQNSNDALDVELYGLSLYSVKAHYRFFTNTVTPYASLSVGLSQLSTPEITDGNGITLTEPDKSFSFGLKPEIGIDLGGFIISTSYIVPVKYGTLNKSAGLFLVSIGYRYNSF